MFEALQDERTVAKDAFKAAEAQLRQDLIDVQLDLLEKPDFSVIVLISGLDFPGRSAAARRLMNWMDPRHVQLYARFRAREEEMSHPRMWHYWRTLPPKGKVGLFLNSWYDEPVSNYLVGNLKKSEFETQIQQLMRFERMLVQEGALILKFLFYVPKQESRELLKDVADDKITAWKMSDEDLRIAKHLFKEYDHSVGVLEDVLSRTSFDYAPWIPLRSSDPRYRDLTASLTLRDALRRRLSSGQPVIASVDDEAPATNKSPERGAMLDLSKTLARKTYRKRLKKLQRRVSALTVGDRFDRRGLIAVFEGNDAAGKGGCIRRLVAALDPRMINMVPIAGPTDEERAQPYLWRFWRHIPERGRIVVFDRSWYGRVLVERVERFCSEADWQRAYNEIREFEEELSQHGLIIMKFWLAIDRDEQLRRFQARQDTPYKQYKITEEDWRNREKWDDYQLAVRDMVNRTSTPNAPWTMVAANDKLHARVTILETVAERLKEEL